MRREALEAKDETSINHGSSTIHPSINAVEPMVQESMQIPKTN